MRSFFRPLFNTGAVGLAGATVQRTEQLPDVEGHLIDLQFLLTITMNGGAAGGFFTRRDLLRAVQLTLQDDAGNFRYEGITLEDLEAFACAMGYGPAGFSAQFDATAIGAGLNVVQQFVVHAPYFDRRKGAFGADGCIESKKALNTLRWEFRPNIGSAVDVIVTTVQLECVAEWTPDLPGQIGIRDKLNVSHYGNQSQDVDNGAADYGISDLYCKAPYVAGTASTMAAFGALNTYEGDKSRTVGLTAMTAQAKLAINGSVFGPDAVLEPAASSNPFMPHFTAVGVDCGSFAALPGTAPNANYSSADLIRGKLRVEWTAIPGAGWDVLTRRVYALTPQEGLSRYPELSGVDAKNTLAPSAGNSERTKAFSPTKVIGVQPGEQIQSVLRRKQR